MLPNGQNENEALKVMRSYLMGLSSKNSECHNLYSKSGSR